MRQQVTWCQRTVTANSVGQPVENWSTTVGPFWAQVEPLNGRELIIAQAQESQTTHRVLCRWPGNISPQDQLTYTRYLPDGTTQTVTLAIESVIDIDEQHAYLELECKEIRNA